MPQYKVLDKNALRRFSKEAEKRGITGASVERLDKLLEKQPDDTLYPIGFSYLHNDKDVRCSVTLNEDSESVLLDIPLQNFNHLPSVEVDE